MRIAYKIDDQLSDELRAAPLGVRRYVDKHAVEPAINMIIRDMKLMAPQASTELVNSMLAERVAGKLNYWRARVSKLYASNVELGSQPGGAPSVQTLTDWVKVKRIRPRDPSMTLSQLVYAIRRSIHARGTRKQPYAEPALEKNRERTVQMIEAAYVRGLELELNL